MITAANSLEESRVFTFDICFAAASRQASDKGREGKLTERLRR